MTEAGCPFCAPPADRIFHAGRLTLGLWDGFPVSPGHALLVTKRHVASWFDASTEEQQELTLAIEVARREVMRTHNPDGFNVGINVGDVAGQTVSHLHVHVIPRYRGDVSDPSGGVRHVIPAKGNYLSVRPPPGFVVADRTVPLAHPERRVQDAPHTRALITGGDDALIRHLAVHLDRAQRADIAVAFVLKSGIALLIERLRDLLTRKGTLRIVTGNYLDVTDPDALLNLLDLREEFPDATDFRVFEANEQSFHPKAYIFYSTTGEEVALVGSSNLTATALTTGVEWNFRTVTARDPDGFAAVRAGFHELLSNPQVRRLDAAWIDAYRARRIPRPQVAGVIPEPPAPPPDPHVVQQRALRALAATRAAGNRAGLVVLATGLGKTWLSAFDSTEFPRVLFVAHRDEILQQALSTYRRIRPHAHLGLYTGDQKVLDAEVVFASIQTLGRAAHLERFAPTAFDYIVVDEFHHASAKTYRRLIDYFDPRFLLGLTATPERTDGGDLLALCQENLVFRCDMAEGIGEDLLSPFHYFGVPDEVDYRNIPWRNARFDEAALTQAVATQARARNALEQYRQRGGKRTLAFCCSTRHADFMRDFFLAEGVAAASVHSGRTSDARVSALERLQSDDLKVVFAVDLFNEGVDLPNIDTVMMLRPTESRILWLQQFGRGLRKAGDKSHLTVIDYIGNHRTFLLNAQTLFDLPAGDAQIADQLTRLERKEATLPPGCEVTYDLRAIDILRQLLRLPKDDEALRFYYEDFRDRFGVRPTASEMHHDGYSPRSVRRAYGSWLQFVGAMSDLGGLEQRLVREGRPAEFLSALETTQMTRSFKMLVLLAMIQAGRFPGELTIDELGNHVRRLALRSEPLRRDIGVNLDDARALTAKLEKDPINAWVGGKGTGDTSYFAYENGVLRTTLSVGDEERGPYVALVQEIAQWRLAEYLDRPLDPSAVQEGSFVCRVSHSGGKPILFLPSRKRFPSIPLGKTRIRADGEEFEADFVKVAVNVIRRGGSSENILPELIRRWFGPDAGHPGTHREVLFERDADRLVMSPRTSARPEVRFNVGQSYMRAQIPAALGLEFKRMVWEQGFVPQGGQIFLLVTLNKAGMPEEHHYGDRFLSRDRFEWKSQNRTTQASPAGQAICKHAEHGTPVHLFLRKTGKIKGKAAPFIYCGQVDFVEWQGEKPITVQWRLREPLSDRLARLMEVAIA